MKQNKGNFSKTPANLQQETFLKNILFETIGAHSLEEALKTLSRLTGEYFDADYCLIIQYNPKKDKFSTNYHEYISRDDILGVKNLDLNLYNFDFLKTKLLKEFQPILASDTKNFPYPNDIKNLLHRYKIQSNMLTTLIYQNQPLGILSINTQKDKYYTKEDLKTLTIISSHLSFVLHKLNFDIELKKQVKKEEILRKITANCLKSESFEQAINSIVKDLTLVTNMTRGTFRQFDEKFKIFLNVAGDYHLKGEPMPEIHRSTYSHTFSIYMNKRFSSKEITCIKNTNKMSENTSEEKELKQRALILGLKSFHIITLRSYNKRLGFIMIGHTQKKTELDENTQELIKFIIPTLFSSINLFILNKQINKQKEAEIIINKLSTKIEEKGVILYFIKQLYYFFKANNILYLQYDKSENLKLKEYFTTESNAEEKTILEPCSNTFKEIIRNRTDVLFINNVEEEISNSNTKEILKSCHINSFICNTEYTFGKSKQTGIFVIASKTNRTWSYEEVTLFKYLIEFFTNKYSEYKQKIELEETRESFIATLTHDLKSPIVACQKAVEAMLLMPAEILIENLKEYLQDIYTSNEEILKLISNLLSVYHYESSAYKLNYELFDFNKTVISTTTILKHLMIDKNCKVIQNLEEKLPQILGDEGEVKRVLLNLLTNAIKHSSENSKIIICSKKINKYIEYSIQDFGEGISQENITAVFEKFRTSKRITGAGLGLYLSKQIIEAHNGTIWVESQENEGTTFYFKIPFQEC